MATNSPVATENAPKSDPYFEIPEQKSHSAWFSFLSIALLISGVVAIYDETFSRRPWKTYQSEYKRIAGQAYREALAKEKAAITKLDRGVSLKKDQKADFSKFTKSELHQLEAYSKAIADRDVAWKAFMAPTWGPEKKQEGTARENQIVARIRDINVRSTAQRAKFNELRGNFQALTWRYEVYHEEADRKKREEFQKKMEPFEAELNELELERKTIEAERNEMTKDVRDTTAAVLAFKAGVKSAQNLLDTVTERPILVYQQFNYDIGAVDRCESCHVGISDAGLDNLEQPYATHPGDWLTTHPKEKFGCTSCHRGEGFATSATWKAHGQDHYWLQPMLPGPMMQAACLKCHEDRTTLRGAESLMDGKRLVQLFGCVGCHKIRNLGEESNQFKSLVRDRDVARKTFDELEAAHKAAEDSDDQTALVSLRADLQIAKERATVAEYEVVQAQDRIRQIGPDLRKLGSKINWGWLVPWLENPTRFRATTRMPRFWPEPITGDPDRDKEWVENYSVEIKQVAAYLVEDSEGSPRAKPFKADPESVVRGQHLVEEVGCRGCHNITTDDRQTFGDVRRFGPDLDRVGEKIRYEWLVSWVQNPESVQPHTKMPNLRLTDQESQDVAAYLTTLKSEAPPAEFSAIPSFLENAQQRKALAAKGAAVIRKYGCHGCHNINGMEDEGRVGTELSQHGVKMLLELDWGTQHLEKAFRESGVSDAEFEKNFANIAGGDAWKRWREDHKDPSVPNKLTADAEEMLKLVFWRRHDGKVHLSREMYFATKMAEPHIYDKGRFKPYEDRLKMPMFNLKPKEIASIVTFLLGLTPELDQTPVAYQEKPREAARAVLEGDRVIQRLNCRGCHQLDRFPSTARIVEMDARVEKWGQSVGRWLKSSGGKLSDEKAQERMKSAILTRLEELGGGKPAPGESGTSSAGGGDDFGGDDFGGDDFGGDDFGGESASEVRYQSDGTLEGDLVEAIVEADANAAASETESVIEQFKGRLALRLSRHAQTTLYGDVFAFYPPDRYPVAPPPLYPVGARVQSDWLFKFLKKPFTLRPKHEIRMPWFSMADDEARWITAYFAAKAGSPFPTKTDSFEAATPENIASGKALLDESRCLQCHYPGIPDGDPAALNAPNLDLAWERLKPDWISEWIQRPASIQPGTNMPNWSDTWGAETQDKADKIRDYLSNIHRVALGEIKIPDSKSDE